MTDVVELILQDLNPAQSEAVTAPDGPLLVFAGAGSGKTRVLTRRIAYLLTARDVHPSEILAVTFTNKAAGVMLDRIAQLIGGHAHGMWIHTFHSACARLLRSHAALVGRKPGFSIYDDLDQRTLIKELLPKVDLDPKTWSPRQFATWFDRAKNDALDPTECADRVPAPIRDQYQTVAELYKRHVREANAFDFGDLIVETIRLLRENHEVRDSYRQRFRHVLVDEFQDTNEAQYELLRQLLGQHGNLTVVGDDDQSIYRWRGARIANILGFTETYPAATKVVLGTNYRSTRRILRAADSVIQHNLNRQPKNLDTPNPLGAPIRRYLADDEFDEARFVARTIDALHMRDGRRYSDVAIFYRINAQSRILEEKLLERGIPHTVVGGMRFYERKEIKDALAYLRLIANPADRIAFTRVVNIPNRGVGDVTVKRLLELTDEKQLTYVAACTAAAEGAVDRVTKKARQALGRFAQLISDQSLDLFGGKPSATAARILEDSGYLSMLKSSDRIEDRSRLENLEELLRSIEQFEDEAGDEATLALFLEKVSLMSDPDLYDGAAETVSLMTLHTAKGLEFPAVFVVGLENGLLPHERSRDSRAELEEERRLCYVGITRAKQELFLTAASWRSVFGGPPRPTLISPFWNDLPDDVVEDEGGKQRRSHVARTRRPGRAAPTQAEAVPGEPVYDYSESQDPDDHPAQFRVGGRVSHAQFGSGTVIELTGGGRMTRATVRFDRVGTKTLVLLYAKLTPLR